MKLVTVSEVEDVLSPASVKREVGAALGAEGVALNYFELEPGDTFSNTLHTHYDQEEVFYLLEGTASFETADDEFDVAAGQAVRFEPGEFQHGKNLSDGRVVGLVVASPRESEDGSMECPSCGARGSPDVERTDDALVFYCAECGEEINRMT